MSETGWKSDRFAAALGGIGKMPDANAVSPFEEDAPITLFVGNSEIQLALNKTARKLQITDSSVDHVRRQVIDVKDGATGTLSQDPLGDVHVTTRVSSDGHVMAEVTYSANGGMWSSAPVKIPLGRLTG
ncbi:hypothetical protein [Streptomyces inhibens]|uniref:hypothetical protein n=1 Tax=Streptomyces inhibens TaxID=2293571 RepID=UPI000FFBD902|nr:hypothetical protein [Streptomyces inhibens]